MKVFVVLLEDFNNAFTYTRIMGTFYNEINAKRCILDFLYEFNNTTLDKETWINENLNEDFDSLDNFNGSIYYEICNVYLNR
jgi:hypothetical protein